MTLEQVYGRIKKIASVLGIIQSMAWIIMSIMCLAFYFNDKVPEMNSYMGLVNSLIYSTFLAGDNTVFEHQTVTGGVFTAFAFIYLFLDFAWLGFSSALYSISTPKMLTAWSHFTLLLSAWDLILVFIFAADYNKCLSYASDLGSIGIGGTVPLELGVQVLCANGILPVLVIVAKGFILWIINVSLAVIMYRISKEMKQDGLKLDV